MQKKDAIRDFISLSVKTCPMKFPAARPFLPHIPVLFCFGAGHDAFLLFAKELACLRSKQFVR